MGLVIRSAARTTAVLLGFLVAADIVGVIACTIFDIAPLRAGSAMLPYAIWLVLGAFCGLFAYNAAGSWSLDTRGEGTEWTGHALARQTSRVIVATSAILVAALVWTFHTIFWSKGVAGEFFVPDSAPHSIVFFLAVLGAIAGMHHVMLPEQNPGS